MARKIKYKGRTDSVSGWAKHLGISRPALQMRLSLGWDIERALTEPVQVKRKHRRLYGPCPPFEVYQRIANELDAKLKAFIDQAITLHDTLGRSLLVAPLGGTPDFIAFIDRGVGRVFGPLPSDQLIRSAPEINSAGISK